MSRSHGRATDLVSIIPPCSGIRRLIFSNTPLLGVFSSWLTSFPSQFFPPLEESRSSFVFSLEKFLSALIDICFARTCETSHDGNTEGGRLCESTEKSLLSLLYHTLFSSSICIREEVKDLIHWSLISISFFSWKTLATSHLNSQILLQVPTQGYHLWGDVLWPRWYRFRPGTPGFGVLSKVTGTPFTAFVSRFPQWAASFKHDVFSTDWGFSH